MNIFLRLKNLFFNYFAEIVLNIIYTKPYIYGNDRRATISKLANINNALINTASGDVTIEDFAFCAHNVCIITGTHDYYKKYKDRMTAIPTTGRDIVIKKGAWIGTNVTILGPCIIGENSVIAANSLVNEDVAPDSIYAGSPAKLIKLINFHE